LGKPAATELRQPYIGNGPALFQVLDENVRKRADKIKVVYETPGKDLVKNADSVVVGVIAEHAGKPVTVKAKEGRRDDNRRI
jgi:hypothetical protein